MGHWMSAHHNRVTLQNPVSCSFRRPAGSCQVQFDALRPRQVWVSQAGGALTRLADAAWADLGLPGDLTQASL